MSKYSPVIENYFQDVIKKSWSWNRLTEDERKRFINMNVFNEIKGSEKTRIAWLCTIYHAYITALGYMGGEWREELV